MRRLAIEYNGKPAVWPLPNKCRWLDGSFRLPDPLTLRCDAPFAREAGLFRQSLLEMGVNAQFTGASASVQARLTDAGRVGGEAYRLDVTPEGIELAAGTPEGMFYAFQTLAQLIERSPGGLVPAVSIEDAPFKPIRGAHFYVPSRQNLPWFKRFLDFLAKYKYNTIFLEMGASMEFETHPEINAAWESFCKKMLVYPGGPDSNHWGDSGMQMLTGNIKNSVHIENGGGSYISKQEMGQIADWCRERHIRIIPEVQGLSHTYWMLLAHPECAERSDDPYPDTWCPSNPKTYEIYFDCLQEIVDVLKPETVSLGHDEYQWIGFCDRCKDKTGHDIFADDILKCYEWLKERGIRTHVWADKFYNLVKRDPVEIGMGSGGGKHLNWNLRKNANELAKPTFRSLDCMPDDLLLSDWYYGCGPLTQDMFGDRGLQLVFGNFHPASFEDMEARLRRPNVLGAEVSLWHETSDAGMAMVDNFVKFLDAVNILWHRRFDRRLHDGYNRAVSQIYPVERDRMNGVTPPSASGSFVSLDISGAYNSPLKRRSDFGWLATAEPIPGAIPFDILRGVGDRERDPACVLAGDGAPETVGLNAAGRFRSVAFLHAYTAALAGPPAHACTYVGWQEDIVGSYEIRYEDGAVETVPLEYSRDIYTTGSGHAFGAQRANPAFQHRELAEAVTGHGAAKQAVLKETWHTVFAYEWVNPHPEKRITGITVRHDEARRGGIALFAVTGVE